MATTIKDKSLGQSTIMKVHHRIRRLERDRAEQDKTILMLLNEQKKLDGELEMESRALLSARDDENELVLRFVEAKLLHELLCDERSSIEDDIVQCRRDINALGGDLQVKERTRCRLVAVESQRLNELEASERYAQACQKQSQDTALSYREALKQRNATMSSVAHEETNLGAMELRLRSIKESVAEALAASTAGLSSRRGSPRRGEGAVAN